MVNVSTMVTSCNVFLHGVDATKVPIDGYLGAWTLRTCGGARLSKSSPKAPPQTSSRAF